MSGEVFEVAINAYITFRGEAESEEDFVDQVFDEFWEWLQANPKAVNWETKQDYSCEVAERPRLG